MTKRKTTVTGLAKISGHILTTQNAADLEFPATDPANAPARAPHPARTATDGCDCDNEIVKTKFRKHKTEAEMKILKRLLLLLLVLGLPAVINAQASFGSAANYAVGTNPVLVVAADLNLDAGWI